MQSTHFLDFWRPRLAEDGYDAIFKKKGNDLYVGGNVAAIDGCATFFKRSRFQLVKKYEVRLLLQWCQGEASPLSCAQC